MNLSSRQDLNLQPHAPKARILPIELLLEVRDSNPRFPEGTSVFKTDALVHSANFPNYLYIVFITISFKI